MQTDMGQRAERLTTISRKKTLLIAIYRPFSVRFILQTDILETLKCRPDCRIVVATHYPLTPDLKAKYGGDNIVLEELDMVALRESQTASKLRYLMRQVRLLTYNMQGRYYLGYRRFAAYEFRKSLQWKTLRITGKIYNVAILLLPYLLGQSRWLRRGWIRLEDALYGRDTQQHLFEVYQPDLVLVSSLGYGYDEQIINEAKRRGTPVLTTIHSWDNTTTWGYPGGKPDYVIAWSETMLREARDLLDMDTPETYVGGVPHWDNYFDGRPPSMDRATFLEEMGLSPQRKTIYFSVASPKVYRGHTHVARTIAAAISDGRIRGEVQLLIRPHPGHYSRDKTHWNETIEQELAALHDIAARSGGRVTVCDIRVSSSSRSYDFDKSEQERLKALLVYSDVMVNFYSTQAIEAAIFDLPIVNIGFGNCKSTELPARIVDHWDHFARVLATGGVARTYSEDELIEAVNRYLEDPSLDREGRQRIVDQEVSAHRGYAGRAIGEHILALLDAQPENAS